MAKIYRYAALIAVSLQVLLAADSWALTDDRLSALVNNAKIVPVQVKVQKIGAKANFSMYRSPQSSAKDCKIDAVLIARIIMEKDPDVSIVQGYYFMPGDQAYRGTIEVHAGDVQAYKSGGVSAEKLLNSLTFSETGPAPVASSYSPDAITAFAMKPGTRLRERTQIKFMIASLAAKNGDVRLLWNEFREMDHNLEHMSDQEVFVRLKRLNREIDDLQQSVSAAADAEQSSDLTAGPGLEHNRRVIIAQAIRKRGKSLQNVSIVMRDFASAENFAHLNQQAELDDVLNRLENSLGLPRYTGK